MEDERMKKEKKEGNEKVKVSLRVEQNASKGQVPVFLCTAGLRSK